MHRPLDRHSGTVIHISSPSQACRYALGCAGTGTSEQSVLTLTGAYTWESKPYPRCVPSHRLTNACSHIGTAADRSRQWSQCGRGGHRSGRSGNTRPPHPSLSSEQLASCWPPAAAHAPGISVLDEPSEALLARLPLPVGIF